MTLKVYDLLGREVQTLVNDRQDSGVHRVVFNGEGLASGLYIYRLTAATEGGKSITEAKKMILVK